VPGSPATVPDHRSSNHSYGASVIIKALIPFLLVGLTSFSACAEKPTSTNLPLLTVYKSPTCGCCIKWVEHMREAGFEVTVNDVDNVQPVKMRVGVPPGKGSCHTAEVGGYFLEGHVPASDVKRLLTQRPAAKGLAVPGMPLGSPGMEVPDGRKQPYDVELVANDGTTRRFSRHGE
jgi:hypothetical protein